MKTRTAVSLLFVSLALLASGSLFKVLHWPSANIQLLVGTVLHVTALITLATMVARRQSVKELLES
ncbi:MAG: hypothetical protein JNJ91_00375 [Flavobacteriales bacterium]|jgi:hypothetical protein|nr:hypothetical protein [Flavobacteriales bacterium]